MKFLRFLLAAALLVIPAIAKPHGCLLAPAMEQAQLPSDIAVRTDAILKPFTTEAMDFWVARLSTPGHPITWHFVKDLSQCNLYVQRSRVDMMDHSYAAGEARLPGDPLYDGIARAGRFNTFVVAHEIGHLLGFKHGEGVMRPVHDPKDEKLEVSDWAVHYAGLRRTAAAGGVLLAKR